MNISEISYNESTKKNEQLNNEQFILINLIFKQ